MGEYKLINKFNEDDIEIVIEMPVKNNQDDKKIIEEIRNIMDKELLKLNK